MVLRFTPHVNVSKHGQGGDSASELVQRDRLPSLSTIQNDRLAQQRAQEDAKYDDHGKIHQAAFSVNAQLLVEWVRPYETRRGHHPYYRVRLYANFPWLMDMPLLPDGRPFRFTELEMMSTNEPGVSSPDRTPSHTFDISTRSQPPSPRLAAIRTKIEEWRDRVDPTGRPACQIFFSLFVGARIIWLVSVAPPPFDLYQRYYIAHDRGVKDPERSNHLHPSATIPKDDQRRA